MHFEPKESAPKGHEFTRRRFIEVTSRVLVGVVGVVAAAPRLVSAGHHEDAALPAELLEKSPFVYISPLRRDGKESTCHAEVWYAWLDESVVVTVASDRWKATALAAGLDRARIWVGDHGRWKTWIGGPNEDFRKAPNFEARVEKASDPALLDRLLATYEKKYPDEIASWRDRMRQGYADGSRTLLRYRPV